MARKYKWPPFFDEPQVPRRPCDQEGCDLSGEFKAPRDQANLKEYRWFCLEHVRAYNERWNYYSGMNEQEIERERRLDVTWQRPTWPFAQAAPKTFLFHQKRDPLNILDGHRQEEALTYGASSWFPPETEEAKALALMGLTYPFTRKELKVCYVEFAKKYHPDMNGGSREAETRLKTINHAYEVLKKLLKF